MARKGPRDRATLAVRLLLGASVVVVIVAAAGWFFFGTARGADLLNRTPSVVTYGVSVTPDSTGTQVEITGEVLSGTLPSRLDVDLRIADDATLAGGKPAGGGRLHYSDVQDGLGNTLPADQVRSGKLHGVGTDGHQLRLSFHVDSVDGVRVVYPIPSSDRLRWYQASVYAQGATVACATNGANGGTDFSPCPSPTGDSVEGTGRTSLRLVLTATSPVG